jgi:Mrp family chromosome partitioning ATPase
VILGALLGLLLGVIFAFLRDALDRRLRSPRDVESSFHYPILGYVRNEAMGRMSYTTNGKRRSDQQLDIEAFRIVRRNLEFLADESSPRSILVTSGLPEEGKTTVAGSLAFAMAAAGKTTLLVDCDLRRPMLSTRLQLKQSPGISDFLVGRATPEEILRTVEFNEAHSRNGSTPAVDEANPEPSPHKFACVPAGSSISRATETLGSPQFKEFIDQVSQVYDIVIFDSSPLLPVADTLEILPHVDAVIICAREFKTTRAEASAAKAALSRLPERPTGLVVTGVKPGRDDYYDYSYYQTA